MNEVTDNPAKHRFELTVDGHLAHIAYRTDNGIRVLYHTEVPEELGGKGVGGKLAKGAFDLLRAKGEKVKATCPFLVKWLERNPAYCDLIVS